MSKAKELVEMIRRALGDDADDLTRRRAINACDQLLAVMSTEPGKPLPVPPAPQPVAQPVVPTLATPTAGFSPATQMLDALIAKIKSQLPTDKQATEPAPSKSLRIPFVPIPGHRAAGGGS